MRPIILALVLTAGATTLIVGQSANWYPSRWGADDQRGAANRITPAKVLEAKSLISRGTDYQLGRVYETACRCSAPAITACASRRDLVRRAPTRPLPRRSRQRRNRPGWHAVRRPWTHRRRRSVLQRPQPAGVRQSGRADEARGRERRRHRHPRRADRRGGIQEVPRLDGGYEISVADLQGALKRQGLALRAGDVALVHTGWGSLWIKDNAAFTRNAPGSGSTPVSIWSSGEVTMVGLRIRGRLRSCRTRTRRWRFRCISCSFPATVSTYSRISSPRNWRATARTSSRSCSRRCA